MPRYLLKNKVEQILNEHAGTRNSDIDLTLWVWWTYYRDLLEWKPDMLKEGEGEWLVTLGHVRDLPSEDKISRIRRKFQEAGQYPATDPLVIARRQKEREVRAKINTDEWGDSLE